MSHGTHNLDDVLEGAWRRFRTSLADAIDALETSATLDIRRETRGELASTPCVHVRRDGDRLVLAAARNRILTERQKLSKPARRRLRELGFAKASKAAQHYLVELPVTRVDQAASLVVRALREGYGVVHPVFLVAEGVDWHVATSVPQAQTRVEVVRPDGKAHLDELIDEAIQPLLGHAPRRDADGDIAYREGTAVVFIRSRGRTSLIRLFAEMVVDIEDVEAARREAEVLNREVPGIKFTVEGDKLVASAELQGAPFVAEHLQILLAHLADTVATRDAELAQRLGGRVFAEPDAEAAGPDIALDEVDIHPIMFSLFDIDASAPGALRASVAAELCGHDSGVLNDLIRWNQDQQTLWRKSRDQAHSANDHDLAQLCEAQRVHAARTVRVLRKALRRGQSD